MKKKILITGLDRESFGGVENYINLLFKYINNDLDLQYFSYGISPTWYRLKGSKTKAYLKYIFSLPIKTIKFAAYIKKNKPDSVHLNPSLSHRCLYRDGCFSLIAKMCGIETLFFIHGWREKEYKNIINSCIKKKLFLSLLLKQNRIVVLGEKFKRKLVEFGVSKEKVFVISTPVESKIFRPQSRSFNPPHRILFCATLLREKGPYELLEAIPIVLKKYPKTTFTFVGSGPELKNLKKLCSKTMSNKNVKFMGYKKGEEKIRIFKNSNIFVCPSYTEGFPTVILEAMSAGMPLVTTPVGGLADALKDGKQGFLIKSMPPEPKEVAEKIIKLIENPELMKKMSKNNLKEAKEKYDIKIVTEKIEKIYFDVG